MSAPVDPEAAGRAAAVLGPLARPDMPIGPLTTYRVGGAATLGVLAGGVDDLRTVAAAVEASGLPVLVVGRGSNLLVADAGFGGIAVVLDGDSFGTLETLGDTVTAGAALPLPALARRTAEGGLTGLEWAVGVPGSVGGGVRMNAGGHGSDMAATLAGCTVVDLAAGADAAPRLWTPADLELGYRRSALRPGAVVVTATFALAHGDPAAGRETIREIVRWRREHQPGGQNAGSVFVNPPAPPVGDPDDGPGRPGARSAGWLVDHAGLRGLRVGTAQVSAKHANFIQADPGGHADDVFALIDEVRRRVRTRWGVELRTEIRLIGFSPSPSPSPSTGGSGF